MKLLSAPFIGYSFMNPIFCKESKVVRMRELCVINEAQHKAS